MMENLQTPLLIITLVGYLLAVGLYIVNFFVPKIIVGKLARLITVLSLVFNTLVLVVRTILIGTLPLTNLFEFGLLFSWAIIITYLIVDYKYDLSALGIFALPIAILLLLWLTTIDGSVRPIMPALRSNWLFFHVLTAVLAYGAFALSFALSLMYLLKDWLINKGMENPLIKALPSLELLDEVTYKIIFIGLPFQTIMLVTGAVWAEYSWGSYWSWDPKETWALITWFIYAAYLHVRLMAGWKGKKAAYISILGFMALLFTFIGVSYLLPGAHSYV